MTGGESFVVDTSVAIKWIVDEEDSDKAELLQGADMVAPALFRIEASNVLRTLVSKQVLANERAIDLFLFLQTAPVTIIDADELLERRALDLALALEHPIYDCVYLALAERMDALTLGDPLAEGTDLGPLTSVKQRDAVHRYMDIADQEGLTVVRDGKHRTLPAQGYFLAPTLYRDVPVESRLWKEEIFGPVLCGRSVASEAEAIQLANDSDYGLAATVISGDPERARRIGRQLKAGSIWYNSEQLVLPETAWGGFKRSGIGRELGPWGLSAYLEVKHVVGAE